MNTRLTVGTVSRVPVGTEFDQIGQGGDTLTENQRLKVQFGYSFLYLVQGFNSSSFQTLPSLTPKPNFMSIMLKCSPISRLCFRNTTVEKLTKRITQKLLILTRRIWGNELNFGIEVHSTTLPCNTFKIQLFFKITLAVEAGVATRINGVRNIPFHLNATQTYSPTNFHNSYVNMFTFAP